MIDLKAEQKTGVMGPEKVQRWPASHIFSSPATEFADEELRTPSKRKWLLLRLPDKELVAEPYRIWFQCFAPQAIPSHFIKGSTYVFISIRIHQQFGFACEPFALQCNRYFRNICERMNPYFIYSIYKMTLLVRNGQLLSNLHQGIIVQPQVWDTLGFLSTLGHFIDAFLREEELIAVSVFFWKIKIIVVCPVEL